MVPELSQEVVAEARARRASIVGVEGFRGLGFRGLGV